MKSEIYFEMDGEFRIQISDRDVIYAKRIAFELYPQKAPIVFIHDSLGSIEIWRDFPELVSQYCQRPCFVYDRRGYGRSSPTNPSKSATFISDEADFLVNSLLAQLKIEKYILLGHSVGGAMAYEAAKIAKQKCQAVISISAQSFVEELTLSGIKKAKTVYNSEEMLKRLEKYHPHTAKDVLEAWINTWLSQEFQDWTLQSTLNKVFCPALIIHGDHDEYGSLQHAIRIETALSSKIKKLHLLKNQGHVPHREDPDKIAMEIHHFLNEIAL